MSKKDYIAIGAALREARTSLLYASTHAPETERCIEVITIMLCNLFQADNPRFMRGRFVGFVRGENGSNGGAIKEKRT